MIVCSTEQNNFILFYLMWLKQCEYVHLYAIINVNRKICTLWNWALAAFCAESERKKIYYNIGNGYSIYTDLRLIIIVHCVFSLPLNHKNLQILFLLLIWPRLANHSSYPIPQTILLGNNYTLLDYCQNVVCDKVFNIKTI